MYFPFFIKADSCGMREKTLPLHARLTAKSYFLNYLCNFFYKIILFFPK